MLRLKKFFSLGLTVATVAAVGLIASSCVEDEPEVYYDGTAQVRFTWENAALDEVYSIEVLASYNDVSAWLYEYDYGHYNQGVDNTAEPLYDGSRKLPTPFYHSDSRITYGNKSKYFGIDAGRYTAICTVEDQHGFFDIVANYTITINRKTASSDGTDKWFEVAFDILGYIDETPTLDDYLYDEWPVALDEYNRSNIAPMLTKSPVNKLVKKKSVKTETEDGSIEIDYYVFRRAAK